MEDQNREPQEETRKASSRRTFLQQAAGTGIATVAGVSLLPRLAEAGKPGELPTAGKPVAGVPPAQTPPPVSGGGETPKPVSPEPPKSPQVGGALGGDLEVLNFALLLERLEAAFYNQNYQKGYLTGSTVQKQSFQAILTGSELTPPITTAATGTGNFELSQDQTMLSYDVQLAGLSGPATGMHLRRGARGVAGDIVYTLNTPDATGRAVGATPINPTDINDLLNQGLYLSVPTAANPAGEVRGQIVVLQAPGTGVPGTTGTLKAIVDEIRDHENAHVALLEQALGANAQPSPQFQNLDAPTLQQFLTMAQTFEDVGVSAYLGQLPLIQDNQTLSTAGGIMAVEARHAGGLRAYRKTASTAEGGDPNITLTEDREPVNRVRTREQVLAAIQPYLVGGTTPTPITNPTTPTSGTP
jgi:hypothetical protein